MHNLQLGPRVETNNRLHSFVRRLRKSGEKLRCPRAANFANRRMFKHLGRTHFTANRTMKITMAPDYYISTSLLLQYS
jgi:hypothetical protein